MQRKSLTEVRIIPEKISNSKVKENEKFEASNQSDENDDHKLLVAIAYNVKKLDSENEQIVKAIKQNNRYLHSILRHMKELLSKTSSQTHEEV